MASPTQLHLLLRHVWGGYWRLCSHRSHRLRLPCFRLVTYDGYCPKHNDTCFHQCGVRRG